MKELERHIKNIRSSLENVETTLKNIEGLILEAETEGIPITDIPEVKGKGLLKSLDDEDADISSAYPTPMVKEILKEKVLYIRGAFTDKEPLTISSGVPFRFKISKSEEEDEAVNIDVRDYLCKIGFIPISPSYFESDTSKLDLTSSEQLIPILNKVAEKFGYRTVISYDWRMEVE